MTFIKKYWTVFFFVFVLLIFIKTILCVLMLGLMLVFIGIEVYFFLKKIQNKGITCTGKIVDFRTDGDGDKTPLVEFITIKGESIKETPFIHGSINIIEVFTFKKMINKSVSVLYDSDDPRKFVIVNDVGKNNFFTVFFILLGLTLVVFSICNLLGYVKFD